MLLYRFLLSQCLHEERLLPAGKDPGSIGEFDRCWSFFMSKPKVWILANQDRRVFKTVHCIYSWQFRPLWVWSHAFLTVQCTSHVLVANAKLPQAAESNILPHLPWWVIFSQMVEEHLHCLCIVSDLFREHNLKLKLLKCSFFIEEITYLTHRVSKDGVQPSNSKLEVIAECLLPQTYTEMHAFLRLMGHYRKFIKGFTCIAQPLSEHWLGKGPAGSQSGCHLQKMPWRHSKH